MREYMVELKPYVYAISGVFAVSLVSGYFFFAVYQNIGRVFLQDFSRVLEPIRELEPWHLFIFIFLNNSIKTFAALILGIFFGIIPILFIFVNGFLLGIILYPVIETGQLGLFFAGVAPHGILEIPAVIGGAAAGLMLGIKIAKKIYGGNLSGIIGEYGKAFRLFFGIILPVLLVAAAIEAYITPAILRAIME